MKAMCAVQSVLLLYYSIVLLTIVPLYRTVCTSYSSYGSGSFALYKKCSTEVNGSDTAVPGTLERTLIY